MTRFFALAAIIAFATACSPADAPIPKAAESGPVLSYTDAYVTEPVAGRDVTKGGVIVSVSGGNVRLVGASSDAAGTIEMHTMSMDGGTMRMRQVDGFDLADGETLSLISGGNHFMLFDLSSDVIAGESIDILLNFDAGGTSMTLVIEADVKALGE